MNVLVVGLSHRSAPVEVLERVAVARDEVAKLLDELLRGAHVTEVMLLSTCNRIEVYAVVDAFHGGLADVSAVFARRSGLPLGELTEHLYVHYAGSAVQHLFAVAAGLDSMVVGEAQILGQLRGAYAAADEAGTVGRVLHELAQQALRVGKRVHASTGIDAAGASVVSEALADAAAALGRAPGDLTGLRAVVVGAGAMGGLSAAHLRRAGVAEIVVVHRSPARAERLAEVTPTVTALRRRASEVVDGELLRLDSRLPELDEAVREEFARTVRRVVDKLLHTPTVQVKRLAGGPDGSSYAAALRELFELDPQTPVAVAVQRSGDVLAALEAPVRRDEEPLR